MSEETVVNLDPFTVSRDELSIAAQSLAENCPLQPLDDNLIVFRPSLEMTAGGIALPETAPKHTRGYVKKGIVLAVGPGRWIEQTGVYKPIDVKKGDQILFSSMAGFELGEELRHLVGSEAKSTEIIMLRAHDIVAKFVIGAENDVPD